MRKFAGFLKIQCVRGKIPMLKFDSNAKNIQYNIFPLNRKHSYCVGNLEQFAIIQPTWEQPARCDLVSCMESGPTESFYTYSNQRLPKKLLLPIMHPLMLLHEWMPFCTCSYMSGSLHLHKWFPIFHVATSIQHLLAPQIDKPIFQSCMDRFHSN